MAYSFLDLALDVLKKAETPLTYQEVWQSGAALGLTARIGSVGKTPWQSLGAQLYVDVCDNATSKFVKVGKRPARFFLQERSAEITDELAAKIEKADEKRPKKAIGYKERDLHPILTYCAFATPAFNRGRAIVTKTIHHETSKKSGSSEWSHPDMVGFSIPLEDWQPDVIAFPRDSRSMAAMATPRNANGATATAGKVRDSFLNPERPDGGSKAAWLESLG